MARAEQIGRVCAILIVLGFLTQVGFIYSRFFPGAFSSDASVHIALARHLMAEGSLVSLDWLYPNGDIFVLGPHLLGMAMIQWLGYGLPALWFTAALTFALLWFCVLVCLRLLGHGGLAAVVGASAALACVSDFHVEFIYMQAGYPFLMILYTLAFTLYIRLRVAPDGATCSGLSPSVIILLLIIAILAVCNPSRTMAYVLAPMLLVELRPLNRPWRIRPKPLVWGLMAAFVIGYLAYKSLLAQGVQFSLPSGFRGSTVDFLRTMQQVRQVLRFPFGVYAGFDHLVLGGALSAAVIAFAVRVMRSGELSPRASHTMRLCLWQMATVLGGGLISAIFIEPYSVRYFLPALILLGATVSASCVDALRLPRPTRSAWLLAAFSMVIAHAVATTGKLESKVRESGPVSTPHVLTPVTNEIRKRGLRHGFVEWDANVMNVIGQGEVQFCQITYREQLLPFKWNVPTWCYDPKRLPDRFFLVLKPQHTDEARKAVQHSLRTRPTETFEAGGYEVLVYQTANVDTSWLAYPVPDGADLHLPWNAPAANPQMFSRVIEPTPQKTFVFNGDKGEIVYGPYVNLNRGRYRLTWWGDAPGNNAHDLLFYVQSGNGRKRLATVNGRTAPAQDRQAVPIAVIDFKVTMPVPGVNFIVEQRGHAAATLTRFHLERVDDAIP